jgi:VanZ family protein
VKNKGIIIVWNVLVIIGSLMPAKDIPDLKFQIIPHQDKLIHFVMYFVLALLLFFGTASIQAVSGKKKVRLAILGYCFGLGIFLEILQKCFDLGRNFDTFDVLANVTGAVIAAFIYRIYNH